MGLVLFVASSVSGEKTENIAYEMLPFLAIEVVVIFLITYFPALTMTIATLLLGLPDEPNSKHVKVTNVRSYC